MIYLCASHINLYRKHEKLIMNQGTHYTTVIEICSVLREMKMDGRKYTLQLARYAVIKHAGKVLKFCHNFCKKAKKNNTAYEVTCQVMY